MQTEREIISAEMIPSSVMEEILLTLVLNTGLVSIDGEHSGKKELCEPNTIV